MLARIIDLLSPRACVICERRLTTQEHVICMPCNLHLPRTGFASDAYENELARLFWGRLPIERCAALFYYQSHSPTAKIIYEMKYHNHPEIAAYMGFIAAEEFASQGFFDDIDVIIPVPLSKSRQRQRGYNQSLEIAKGVSQSTGLPINDNAVIRKDFKGSQTDKDRWARNDNVKDVFELVDKEGIKDKHILLIDDIITTGATLSSCGTVISSVSGIKISIMSLGYTKG